MKKIKRELKRYGLIPITFGITVGQSAGAFLNSMIEDLVMPIIAFFFMENDWKSGSLDLGFATLQWGQVAANALHFAVIVVVTLYLLQIVEKEMEGKEEKMEGK